MNILCAYTDQKLAHHGQENSTSTSTFCISVFFRPLWGGEYPPFPLIFVLVKNRPKTVFFGEKNIVFWEQNSVFGKKTVFLGKKTVFFGDFFLRIFLGGGSSQTPLRREEVSSSLQLAKNIACTSRAPPRREGV